MCLNLGRMTTNKILILKIILQENDKEDYGNYYSSIRKLHITYKYKFINNLNNISININIETINKSYIKFK